MLLEKRDVFGEELCLKNYWSRGDHHAFSGQNRRDQIGERFARARPRFHDQVLCFGERAFHRFGHLKLAFPVLVFGMPAGEQAVLTEEFADGDGVSGLALRLRHLF